MFTNLHLQKSFKTNQLTPRTTVLLEKLTGLQLVKKLLSFHGTLKVRYHVHKCQHTSLNIKDAEESKVQHAM